MAALDEPSRRPSYWAVLPASVRYDPELSSTAKLLYAEISSLTESYGYCWASNDYFMRLYGFKSDKTVTRSLEALEKKGFIRLEGAGTTKRRIWCSINPLAGAGMENGPPEASAPTDKNVGATDKNVGATDKNVGPTINKKNKQERGTDPPKPPRGRRKLNCDHAPEMFERFWKLYPRGDDKAAARYEWDALQPDPELMREMSAALKRQMQTEEWRRGVGIPYACRWLRDRRWEWEIKRFPPAPSPAPAAAERREELEWEN